MVSDLANNDATTINILCFITYKRTRVYSTHLLYIPGLYTTRRVLSTKNHQYNTPILHSKRHNSKFPKFAKFRNS